MKKLICIFASAVLLGACEQKTEVVTPAIPSPPPKSETGQKVRRTTDATDGAVSAASTPAVSTQTTTESTTTTTASPNP